ncbi:MULTISPECIES: NAD-dependent deacetylase [unclassified Gemella]|uniref:NAD-dependent deacetylase n=1 Tax=unclassified Gemella TaxID=2624949 RepID=UPI001073F5EC|nr:MULTISPECIES: NAD-dependent deacetylase [unclassified Gemella]MBF0710040.1 NAD-dependent deacetylase [Gemella sp. GL1.1]MBF0746119.1 NAD-dependent deacetylase [Gemella sp. 19428wG2_WT2a]NYS27384.1 NAD-dependent deacetylase [Gemella sp. GL1]TFU60408.1 NAD-dependent deacetylase [Gemella sp. WT2a]
MLVWKSLTKVGLSQSEQLAELIREADALVVGVGAGMSASDGFTYIGARFENMFSDFINKYKFLDMLQASLFDFEDWQEYWAFQSRFVFLNYISQPVGKGYLALKSILNQKPYHIITTNADNAFDIADYNMEKIFHIQGKYCLWQCSEYCHNQTYRDDRTILKMLLNQKNMKIPCELVPLCPKCKAPFEINKRNEERGMVEDSSFYVKKEKYEKFLSKYENGKIMYIDIGVGNTTPQFIKHPFWKRVEKNPDALYVVLNYKHYRIPTSIRSRSVEFTDNISELIIKTNNLL